MVKSWINGWMSFGFTVGADWAELVRFHPPQRHQQGERTAGVFGAVPSPTAHWCCEWVCCQVRFEKNKKIDTVTKYGSTLEPTKLKSSKVTTGTVCHLHKRYLSVMQLVFRSRRIPPSGRPTWPPEPGDLSSAGWSTVGWRGSTRTNPRCSALPKRKVRADWRPGRGRESLGTQWFDLIRLIHFLYYQPKLKK